MVKLYQFAGSHYCEKARWALDRKGMGYQIVNLVPGPHRRTAQKLASNTSLPILECNGDIVQGSGEIIDYLDKTIATAQLTPQHSTDASMARELERYLDKNIGVNFRLCFYYHAFQDQKFVKRFLLHETPWWGGPFFAVFFPLIAKAMKSGMTITPDNYENSRTAIGFAFDRLDERVQGQRFLAGPYFSRADLTAAALLFHCWDAKWPAPRGFDALMQPLAERPFYQWAGSIYSEFRHSSTAK